jgi:hypothetical protein
MLRLESLTLTDPLLNLIPYCCVLLMLVMRVSSSSCFQATMARAAELGCEVHEVEGYAGHVKSIFRKVKLMLARLGAIRTRPPSLSHFVRTYIPLFLPLSLSSFIQPSLQPYLGVRSS